MKVKKTLAILEILCPAFFAAESEDGSIKYNTPTGHLLYLPRNLRALYYAIWSPDNDVLTATEKMIRFFINIILSAAFLPLTIVIWTISQLVFAMHYDHRQKNKREEVLLTPEIFRYGTVNWKLNSYDDTLWNLKEDIYIDLTPAINNISSMLEPESKPDRVVVRKIKYLWTLKVDTNSRTLVMTVIVQRQLNLNLR